MSAVKQVFLVVASIAVAYFAPQLIPTIGGWFGASGFIANAIGTLVLAAGLTALQTILGPGGRQGSSPEAGKINVRIPEPPRWLNAGVCRQGGGALFGEFDAQGNFWYLIVHSDSILVNTIKIFFDDVEVTLDASGNVITNDFCLNSKKEPYTGSGTRVPYFQIWTTTYSPTDPVPPAIAAFKAAFPDKWTDDHKLAGTTYSVVRCAALKIEDRYKIYRWRGPFGLGEPAVSIVGEYSLPYDPRTDSYGTTRNAALIWAWFRTHPFGRRKPFDSVNWEWVAQMADICDEVVNGIDGTQPRYECSASIPDNKERHIAESEILLSCDAQLVFDDDGRCWPRVGYYYTPTLALSRNRDIVAMQSVEAQNGESETQGVIVRYTDPDANYTAQPSAPWRNPLYFDPTSAATYLTVDILSIQNHNQAMRVAKAIGERSQPPHKILPSTGLRGLKARQERISAINYDNTFSGDYEIVTPVELDGETGMFCGFGAVPIGPNRWNLLPGEEQSKSATAETTAPGAAPLPSGVVVTLNNGRIEIDFNAATRDDVTYEFEYIPSADIATDRWLDMTVDMDETFAYSTPIDTSIDHAVRWRSVTAGGTVSAWSTPPYTLAAVVTPLPGPTDLSVASEQAGEADLGWRNPSDARFNAVRIYRGTTATFGAATAVADVPGGLSALMMHTDEGLTAGTYYWWFRSFNADDTLQSDPPAGPVTITVG